jgi:hypothetical protein
MRASFFAALAAIALVSGSADAAWRDITNAPGVVLANGQVNARVQVADPVSVSAAYKSYTFRVSDIYGSGLTWGGVGVTATAASWYQFSQVVPWIQEEVYDDNIGEYVMAWVKPNHPEDDYAHGYTPYAYHNALMGNNQGPAGDKNTLSASFDTQIPVGDPYLLWNLETPESGSHIVGVFTVQYGRVGTAGPINVLQLVVPMNVDLFVLDGNKARIQNLGLFIQAMPLLNREPQTMLTLADVPVPEPVTIGLLSVGAIVLLRRRRAVAA